MKIQNRSVTVDRSWVAICERKLIFFYKLIIRTSWFFLFLMSSISSEWWLRVSCGWHPVSRPSTRGLRDSLSFVLPSVVLLPARFLLSPIPIRIFRFRRSCRRWTRSWTSWCTCQARQRRHNDKRIERWDSRYPYTECFRSRGPIVLRIPLSFLSLLCALFHKQFSSFRYKTTFLLFTVLTSIFLELSLLLLKIVHHDVKSFAITLLCNYKPIVRSFL